LTEATLEAQMLLWEWAESCEDDDPEQREMKVRYAEGLVDACEHAGLLAADEVVQWRRLLAQGGAPPPAPGDLDAAERHLEELLAAVRPMSRKPELTAVGAGCRFDAALWALHESGVLSDEVARRWRSRGLAAEAPWLAHDEISELLSRGEDPDVISIAIPMPPRASAEGEAADAEAMRKMEMIVRRRAGQASVRPQPPSAPGRARDRRRRRANGGNRGRLPPCRGSAGRFRFGACAAGSLPKDGRRPRPAEPRRRRRDRL
jgi:hypothetical protein